MAKNIELIKEKLKELGSGPFSSEQLKQRDALLAYLNKENIQGQSTVQANATSSGGHQQTSQATNSFSSNYQTDSNSQTQTSGTSFPNQILEKRSLQELVKEVDPSEQLDEDVEDMILQIADDFIENVINSSCQLAKHRKSNILEAKDVQFHLERNFNIWIPGFGSDDLKPYKKLYANEAHKQRLQLIKKSSKPTELKEKNKD